MTTDITLSPDYTVYPKLVPGYWLYEKLLVENPKKLKRLIKDEQHWFRATSKPEYQQRIRESNEWAAAQIQHDKASGEFAKRQQEMHTALAGQSEAAYITANDRRLLNITDLHGPLTKREIRNAYRRQARRLHPDKGGDAEAFKQMYGAYRKLLTMVKE